MNFKRFVIERLTVATNARHRGSLTDINDGNINQAEKPLSKNAFSNVANRYKIDQKEMSENPERESAQNNKGIKRIVSSLHLPNLVKDPRKIEGLGNLKQGEEININSKRPNEKIGLHGLDSNGNRVYYVVYY